MSEKKDFISTRKSVKYLDLFAGAGGFSEGFMQAYTDSKYYDFCLAIRYLIGIPSSENIFSCSVIRLSVTSLL